MAKAQTPAKVSLRQVRRAAAVSLNGLNNQGRMLEETVLPALGTLTEHVDGAVTRVEALEAIGQRPFWGRLRWLVTGK